MIIHKLKLKNFRNHSGLELEFNPKLTTIVGQNGAGKTNVLEAIYLLSSSRSNKARYDRDMIEHDKDYCSVTGFIFKDGDEVELEVQIVKSPQFENASSKKEKVNKVSKGQKVFNSMFNTVIFTPEDIDIITGSPSERRKYMDLVLSQIDFDYKKSLAVYTKSLRQRNKILERINELGTGQDLIEFWEEELLKSGVYIQSARTELINFYSKEIDTNLKEKLDIIYKQNVLSRERIDSHKSKEIQAKTTLVGPHRDDFEVLMDSYNLGEFGSRGQQRSALLSLKIAEINFIEEKSGEKPVLLLDDIFSELDEDHKKVVLDIIKNQQTLITSVEEVKNIDSGTKIINLR